jgi:hypothetical protein
VSTSLSSHLGYALLAVVFGTAAAAKGRGWVAFAKYLSVALGKPAIARPLAFVVIGLELLLAGGLLTPGTMQAAVLGAGAFVLVASGFIGWRLVVAEDADCRCWGGRKSRGRPARNGREIVKPVWYGLRNGVLLLGAWLLLTGSDGSKGYQGRVAGLISLAACPVIVGIGLIVSIVKSRRVLDLPEHPLKTKLSPQLAPLVALSWYVGSGRRLQPTGVGGQKERQERKTASSLQQRG